MESSVLVYVLLGVLVLVLLFWGFGAFRRPGRPPEASAPEAPQVPPAALPSSPEPAPPPARKGSQRRHKAKPPHAPTVSEAPLNPSAWWNTLQDQFTRIAASAAAGAAAATADQQAPAKKSSKTAGTRRAAKAGKSR